MENILLPSSIDYEKGKSPNVVKLVVEPLFPGFGTTIGNALRRILLSSLPGAAVTAVNIKNTSHDFSTIPKVQEDVLQIIMKLKQLRLKVFTDEPVKLELKVKGQKEVKAKDIEPNSEVEIVNPELTIATLTAKDAVIDMEIWVKRGRGYHTTESKKTDKLPIGTIAIDSFFSPVKRVSFNIEPARVGQMTNYDKLIMEIETDETIGGKEAIEAATKVLVDHFSIIGNANSQEKIEKNDSTSKAEIEETKADEGETVPVKKSKNKA